MSAYRHLITGLLRAGLLNKPYSALPAAAISTRQASKSALDVSGIFPPIPTPFNADESIAYDKLEANIKKWNEIPLRGYVVQGSNGEYAYLTDQERVDMVQYVCKIVPKDKLIIAGSGCESTSQTISMTKKMADAGAAAVLVVTPCYFKANMTTDALVTHYTKVADSSPVPVILYSVPSNTGLDLAPEAIIKLASHPNIIGVKDSGGDVSKLGLVAFKTRELKFQILAGSAGFLLPAMSVGCVGGICGLANILGREVCTLVELFKKGDLKAASALQQRLIGPNSCVTRRYGVPGLKFVMDKIGYYGGPTRLPMLPVSQTEAAIIQQTFKDSGFM